MSDALLRVEKVTKRFGGFTALDDVDLAWCRASASA